MADFNGEMNTRDPAVNMKPPPASIISTTKTTVESTSAGNGSTLVFEGNSKCSEAEGHSSDGIASTWSISAKSEISQDDSQHRTESSCSNSFKTYGDPTGDQHAGAICKILVHSSNSENLNCSSGKEENIRSCNEHLTSHSVERTISSEISGESENISKLGHEIIDNAKSESSKEQNTFVAGFDLNEDINGDDYIIQPTVQTLSSHCLIHVVAKAAVPRGIPMKPLKFEGELGWKGSAETSAFRSTICNYSRKSLMGFDLNVAAGEDCASNGFLDSSSREVGLRKTEGLGFDLNCHLDDVDEFPKPSPHESRIPSLMDLNLNSDSEIPVKREAYSHGQDFFMDGPKSLQQLEFMQRVSPFQQKLQCTSHALPPRSYMSKAPFHFSVTDPLPSTIHYARDMPPEHPKENSIFTNPRMDHSVGPPYFVQVAHGHSNSAVSMPKVEEYLSRSGSKMDEARQLFFLANSSQTEEQAKSLHQKAWYATSAKRKEPEGGSEYYQLGYRC